MQPTSKLRGGTLLFVIAAGGLWLWTPWTTGIAAAAVPRTDAIRVGIPSDLPSAPIALVANHGQWDERIAFRALSTRAATWIERDRITLGLFAAETNAGTGASGWALQFEFVGAESSVGSARGETPMPGRHHYFTGSDPADWHVDVPLFESVGIDDLVPGVDLRL
jgi:hypothetical protein